MLFFLTLLLNSFIPQSFGHAGNLYVQATDSEDIEEDEIEDTKSEDDVILLSYGGPRHYAEGFMKISADCSKSSCTKQSDEKKADKKEKAEDEKSKKDDNTACNKIDTEKEENADEKTEDIVMKKDDPVEKNEKADDSGEKSDQDGDFKQIVAEMEQAQSNERMIQLASALADATNTPVRIVIQ